MFTFSLNSRKESSFNLGTAEQKLLYTLHWILSDAADECSLQAEEEGKLDISTFAYLFPLSAITVTLNMQYFKSKDVCIKVFVQHFADVFRIYPPFFQTFIYLFAPICTNIRESDFANNFRLENGKQIWHALWEYRHPDAEGFIAPVSLL